MFQKSVALVLASLAVSVALAAQDAANDKDKKALQGKWKVVSLTSGGETKILGPDGKKSDGKMRYLLFEGETVKFTTEDKVDVSATFTVDAGKSPKAIDMKEKERGRRLYIYELKGDELKLCFIDVGGAPRPKEFSSTRDDLQMILVLRRVK
jgi:uncharacterized protein (TIGR03067 family)